MAANLHRTRFQRLSAKDSMDEDPAMAAKDADAVVNTDDHIILETPEAARMADNYEKEGAAVEAEEEVGEEAEEAEESAEEVEEADHFAVQDDDQLEAMETGETPEEGLGDDEGAAASLDAATENAPSKPTRAMTAWGFFLAERFGKKMSREAGEMWRALSVDDKAMFEEKAVTDKERYQVEMVGWKKWVDKYPELEEVSARPNS